MESLFSWGRLVRDSEKKPRITQCDRCTHRESTYAVGMLKSDPSSVMGCWERLLGRGGAKMEEKQGLWQTWGSG